MRSATSTWWSSAQDPNEEAKAAVGEAEVRVYMEYGRLYFGCSFYVC